uniref:Uncharacterized protein n=1 Tax=viral metagenome TaxID=1070528 RepID=A0A2V0RC63_9ZZZZ
MIFDFLKIKLEIKNVFRKLTGYNTTIIPRKEFGDERGFCSRSGRVDMQVPANPVNPIAVLAAIAYGLKATLTPVVYVLSVSKALVVATGTALVVRPGIPWRAVREVEKLLARILRYRSLTPIADEEVAIAMGNFLLGKLSIFASSPLAFASLLGVIAYFGINGVKSWIEFLVDYLSRGEGPSGRGNLPSPRNGQLFLPDTASIAEENRRLKLKIKQMERAKRFRGGNIKRDIDYEEY